MVPVCVKVVHDTYIAIYIAIRDKFFFVFFFIWNNQIKFIRMMGDIRSRKYCFQIHVNFDKQ